LQIAHLCHATGAVLHLTNQKLATGAVLHLTNQKLFGKAFSLWTIQNSVSVLVSGCTTTIAATVKRKW